MYAGNGITDEKLTLQAKDEVYNSAKICIGSWSSMILKKKVVLHPSSYFHTFILSLKKAGNRER